MASYNPRSSGLDFADKQPAYLDSQPGMDSAGPSHLARNKTERRRLQGLQRNNTTGAKPATKYVPVGALAKFRHWMINDGGRWLFYGVWLFLHFLVLVFGFIHYQLKDNSVGARATFGITFRKRFFLSHLP
jgi:hypothetical protein